METFTELQKCQDWVTRLEMIRLLSFALDWTLALLFARYILKWRKH